MVFLMSQQQQLCSQPGSKLRGSRDGSAAESTYRSFRGSRGQFPAPECGSQPSVALGPLLAPLSIRHACDTDTCSQAGTHPYPWTVVNACVHLVFFSCSQGSKPREYFHLTSGDQSFHPTNHFQIIPIRMPRGRSLSDSGYHSINRQDQPSHWTTEKTWWGLRPVKVDSPVGATKGTHLLYRLNTSGGSREVRVAHGVLMYAKEKPVVLCWCASTTWWLMPRLWCSSDILYLCIGMTRSPNHKMWVVTENGIVFMRGSHHSWLSYYTEYEVLCSVLRASQANIL